MTYTIHDWSLDTPKEAREQFNLISETKEACLLWGPRFPVPSCTLSHSSLHNQEVLADGRTLGYTCESFLTLPCWFPGWEGGQQRRHSNTDNTSGHSF